MDNSILLVAQSVSLERKKEFLDAVLTLDILEFMESKSVIEVFDYGIILGVIKQKSWNNRVPIENQIRSELIMLELEIKDRK